ncbi:hypothetical protein J31TS4_45540 [Paenibacillus sp. J31TS4]|uniref:ABC transporter permease n=1 Tax=Paenibacillus sp. J31TS4 TaxID=2807195 RepID=UPI001B03E6DE|nr:ABC-2 family transporter protein [Paenibacillus sp. J31TS4]GIP41274.1 hypothetical protein J31TS4_45540 [Paenibacillus sp. J31TS4]
MRADTFGESLLSRKWHKYAAVGRITVSSQLAYLADFFIRTLFLVVIIYIFMQLWKVTYEGVGETTIAGYAYRDLIWYLIFAEAIILASPRVNLTVEEEVKSGAVAYRLTRPLSYIGYHYVAYLGEAALRLAVNLIVGGLLGVLAFGVPSFGWGWGAFAAMLLGALTVNFLLRMALSLCAFWVEETQGLVFVYDKLLFTIGGMMLPLELFPDLLRRVCAWLPFQTVVYFPSKTIVAFDAAQFPQMLLLQWVWVIPLAALVGWIYAKGVKKLNVNGG